METPEQLKEEGLSLFQRGDYKQALATFESAAQAYAAQNDDAGRAEMLNNIGVIHRLQRNSMPAIEALSEAEAIFARLADNNRRAQALSNLADLQATGGNQDEAARCYSEAAALFARTNDPMKQSQVLRAMSLMRLRQGQWLEAMMRMEESLSVRPRLEPGRWLFRGLLRFALGLLVGR